MYEPKTQKAVFGNALVWLVAVLAVTTAVSLLVLGWRWVTADTRGKVEAREKILSGDSRIQAYDHFFDLCAAVQSLEVKLDAQYDTRESATGDELERVNTNIAGLVGARADAENQYNADARKGYTIGQFRASDLPFQLPTYAKGVHTSCVA